MENSLDKYPKMTIDLPIPLSLSPMSASDGLSSTLANSVAKLSNLNFLAGGLLAMAIMVDLSFSVEVDGLEATDKNYQVRAAYERRGRMSLLVKSRSDRNQAEQVE